jgi:hypothetical protein
MSFEDRLREKLKRAETQMPLARVDLRETMVGARRGLMLRYALSTLAIIVGIAGGAFAANDLFGNDVPTPGPAGSPSPEQAPTPSRSESATEQFVDPNLAVPAAKAWIAAMGEGDREQAWDLLTPGAKASYDSYADFATDTGLSEGWATWAFAEDVAYYHDSFWRGITARGPTAVVVVTITGTRQVEGTTERGAGAMVVYVRQDGALVDPFDRGGANIEPTGTLGNGDPFEAGKPVSLEAHLPSRRMDVFFFVSTQEAVPMPVRPAETAEEQAGGSRVLAWVTLRPLPPGNYWVTIAASLQDGTVWTRPVEFTVE